MAQTLCSCSPTKFNFQLNFQGNCDSTSLTGVSDELCFINLRPSSDSAVGIDKILSMIFASEPRRNKKEDFWRRLSSHRGDTTKYNEQRVLNSEIPTRVTTVEIFEYDTTNELNVINQEVLSNQSLADGDIIEFTSISSKLDPNKPLQEQLQYFPGGLILKYVGTNSNNENVSNTIAWGYNIEDCTTEQISVGDYIGWTTVENVTLANGAFCPATVTPPPTLSPTISAKPITPTTDPTTTAKPITANPVTANPKPSTLPSASKAGKATTHSPIYDWSGGHHKPTSSPIYDWKDKPTTSPIYDWTGNDPTRDPTKMPSGAKPPSPPGPGWGGDAKSSKWNGTKSGKREKSSKRMMPHHPVNKSKGSAWVSTSEHTKLLVDEEW